MVEKTRQTRMLVLSLTLIGAALAALVPTAGAAPLPAEIPGCQGAPTFLEDWDAYAASLNWGGANGWTVTGGTVDLVADGTHSIDHGDGPDGNFIDTDGSTSNGGLLAKDVALDAGTQRLVFEIGGNNRNTQTDGLTVTVRDSGANVLVTQTYDVHGNDPMTLAALVFNLGAAETVTLQFEGLSNDNIGVILDEVVVCFDTSHVPVPELSTALLGLVGFGLLGAIALGWTGVVRRQ